MLIPWGGGGLTTGIASALRALRPETKVYVCEPETRRPVTAAIANGREPVQDRVHAVVHRRRRLGRAASEDVGARARARHGCVRDLPRRRGRGRADALERARIVGEGAAGLPIAAALAGLGGEGRVVCIVSGGNIDSARLATILEGGVPD